jgi:hypothetical protein
MRQLAASFLVLGALGCVETAAPLRTKFTRISSGTRTLAQSIPNSVKYRDLGTKPASGKSGAATLSVRALLDAQSNATVEAVTGTFDEPSAPGTITKMQVKIVGMDALATFNYRTSSNAWSQVYPNVLRGDAIQVLANVADVEPNRTDVVTVATTAVRRPDLEVDIWNTPRVPPGGVAFFSGIIREKNGDVGARTNCVLVINGEAVDQAAGMWVDAGDEVICIFGRQFHTAGTYSVRVEARDVNPGDWDLSNNTSPEHTLLVEQPDGPVIPSGTITAGEERSRWHYTVRRDGPYPIDIVSDGENDYTIFDFYGESDLPAPGGPWQRVDSRVTVNGATLYTKSIEPLVTVEWDDGFSRGACGEFYNGTDLVMYCGSVARFAVDQWFHQYISYHASGTATYFGNELYCNLGGCNTYVYNVHEEYGTGSSYGLNPGDVVGMAITFSNGTTSHVVDETVRLNLIRDWTDHVISECVPHWDGLGDACWSNTISQRLVYAERSWTYSP